MATSCPEEPPPATPAAPCAGNRLSALVSQAAQPGPLGGGHLLSFLFPKSILWPPALFASRFALAKGGLTLAPWRAPGISPQGQGLGAQKTPFMSVLLLQNPLAKFGLRQCIS